jgi:hypothetical protein
VKSNIVEIKNSNNVAEKSSSSALHGESVQEAYINHPYRFDIYIQMEATSIDADDYHGLETVNRITSVGLHESGILFL